MASFDPDATHRYMAAHSSTSSGWFDWAYKGVDHSFPGNGGPECRDFLGLSQRYWESGAASIVALIALAWAYPRLRLPPKTQPCCDPCDSLNPCKNPGVTAGRAATTLEPVGKRVLLLLMCLTFGIELGFKFATRQMIWIGNPCHLATMMQIFILSAPPSRVVTAAFRLHMHMLTGAPIAILFPVINTRLLPFETGVYFLQHILMLIIPFYCLWVGDPYIPERIGDFSWALTSFGLLFIYHFIPLQILAYISQVNLNNMLCPAVSDPFRGKFYRLFAIGHQFILIPTFGKAMVLLARSFNLIPCGDPEDCEHALNVICGEDYCETECCSTCPPCPPPPCDTACQSPSDEGMWNSIINFWKSRSCKPPCPDPCPPSSCSPCQRPCCRRTCSPCPRVCSPCRTSALCCGCRPIKTYQGKCCNARDKVAGSLRRAAECMRNLTSCRKSCCVSNCRARANRCWSNPASGEVKDEADGGADHLNEAVKGRGDEDDVEEEEDSGFMGGCPSADSLQCPDGLETNANNAVTKFKSVKACNGDREGDGGDEGYYTQIKDGVITAGYDDCQQCHCCCCTEVMPVNGSVGAEKFGNISNNENSSAAPHYHNHHHHHHYHHHCGHLLQQPASDGPENIQHIINGHIVREEECRKSDAEVKGQGQFQQSSCHQRKGWRRSGDIKPVDTVSTSEGCELNNCSNETCTNLSKDCGVVDTGTETLNARPH